MLGGLSLSVEKQKSLHFGMVDDVKLRCSISLKWVEDARDRRRV